MGRGAAGAARSRCSRRLRRATFVARARAERLPGHCAVALRVPRCGDAFAAVSRSPGRCIRDAPRRTRDRADDRARLLRRKHVFDPVRLPPPGARLGARARCGETPRTRSRGQLAPRALAPLVFSQPTLWFLRLFLPTQLAQIAGTPAGYRLSAEDRCTLETIFDSFFPMRPRTRGCIFDGYVGNPDIANYPLELVTVPTLGVHAPDDPLASYEDARAMVARIPGAGGCGSSGRAHLPPQRRARAPRSPLFLPHALRHVQLQLASGGTRHALA